MSTTLFSDQRTTRNALEELDLSGMVRRLLQDAFTAAIPGQWERRARVFESCRPRPGDYTGAATRDELAVLDRRNALIAAQCRLHAAMLRGDDLLDERHAADVALVDSMAVTHD